MRGLGFGRGERGRWDRLHVLTFGNASKMEFRSRFNGVSGRCKLTLLYF